jgi:hypothetical protein
MPAENVEISFKHFDVRRNFTRHFVSHALRRVALGRAASGIAAMQQDKTPLLGFNFHQPAMDQVKVVQEFWSIVQLAD